MCQCTCIQECGYRLKHPDVFSLIQTRNLWHALLNNLMNLLELDVEVCVCDNCLACIDGISKLMADVHTCIINALCFVVI